MLKTVLSRARSTFPAVCSSPSRNGSDSGGRQDASASTPIRSVSLARLIPNIIQDQVRIWLFPKSLFEGKHWKPVLIFLVATSGLLVIDSHDPGYFRHARAFYGFNVIVSGWNAAAAMWVVTLLVLAVSMIRRDFYMRHTVFYAIEAVVNSEILTQALKGIDRRVRPQDVYSYHHLLDSWFRDQGHWYSGPGSFPSGHMIAAMSLATVFALRYSERRWVPWTAYGLAAVIGFSRISLLSHFPSDVFAGGVFGYVISRFIVLRPADAQPISNAEMEEDRELPHVEAAR